MRFADALSRRGYHTAIITSFAYDPPAFDDLIVSRLRKAGCRNIILIVDQGMLNQALNETYTRTLDMGNFYSIIPASGRQNGVFHPKVILQIGISDARMLVGSANMTSSGISGNYELEGEVKCDDSLSPEQAIIAAGWDYLASFLDTAQTSIIRQLQHMHELSPWLARARPAEGPVTLEDGQKIGFFSPQQDQGILAQYQQAVGDTKIDTLTVMSPYWDNELEAIRQLVAAFQPQRVRILIDPRRQMFPAARPDLDSAVTVHSLAEFAQRRFVHAKLFVASSTETDHILYGSANCSLAALDSPRRAGRNEEACLYQTTEANSLVVYLGLLDVLEEGEPIESVTLPAPIEEEHPEFAGSTTNDAAGSVGTFECNTAVVSWWPGQALQGLTVTLTLLDDEMNIHTVVEQTVDSECITLRLADDVRIACVDIDAGNLATRRAPVNWVSGILYEARKASGRRYNGLEKELINLPAGDFRLLELLHKHELILPLDTADTTGGRKADSTDNPVPVNSEPTESEPVNMSYAEFMQRRQSHKGGLGRGRNSLSGAQECIEAVLLENMHRLAQKHATKDEDDREEAGVDNSNTPFPYSMDMPATVNHNTYARLKQHTKKRCESAVKHTAERMRDIAETGNVLTSHHLLELRILLESLMIAASPHNGKTLAEMGEEAGWQILPKSGGTLKDLTWPLAVGRALYAMFGGTKPVFEQLSIDAYYGDLSDDMSMAFASFAFALQLSLLEADVGTRGRLEKLSIQFYKLTALSHEDWNDERIRTHFKLLHDALMERLGYDSGRLNQQHEAAII